MLFLHKTGQGWELRGHLGYRRTHLVLFYCGRTGRCTVREVARWALTKLRCSYASWGKAFPNKDPQVLQVPALNRAKQFDHILCLLPRSRLLQGTQACKHSKRLQWQAKTRCFYASCTLNHKFLCKVRHKEVKLGWKMQKQAGKHQIPGGRVRKHPNNCLEWRVIAFTWKALRMQTTQNVSKRIKRARINSHQICCGNRTLEIQV